MSPEDESPVSRRLRALRRGRELRKWLSGEGPQTEAEEKQGATFVGPNAKLAANRTIEFMRKTKALQTLFDSDPATLPAKKAAVFKKLSKLIRYLSGDKDAGIDKDK